MAKNLSEVKSDMEKMEIDEIISKSGERQESSSAKMSEGKMENNTCHLYQLQQLIITKSQ